MVGSKCQILDGAKVEDNVVLLDGTIASPGSVLKSGKVYAGVPAKEVRSVSDEEKAKLLVRCEELNALAGIHAEECGKSHADVMRDSAIREGEKALGAKRSEATS